MKDRRFVIQEHTTPEGVHWDLMLERAGVLITFRLEEPPEIVLDRAVRARKIFDHPLRFLTYEGPVQQATGRVRIVERGCYDESERTQRQWALRLDGTTLKGNFSLEHTKADQWHFAADRGFGADPGREPPV